MNPSPSPTQTPDQAFRAERLDYLRARPNYELNDRVPCRGVSCHKTFPYQALTHPEVLRLIDGQVYCLPCAARVAGGMYALMTASGKEDKAKYYGDIVFSLEQRADRERIRAMAEANVDEVVELEDSEKMRKLLRDPGGAMETKSLNETLKQNILRQDQKAATPKPKVGYGD